jgi:hypothetical protein
MEAIAAKAAALVIGMPSTPLWGTSTSIPKLYEVFKTLGASLFGAPVSGCVHVKTLRPALRLGGGVVRCAGSRQLAAALVPAT